MARRRPSAFQHLPNHIVKAIVDYVGRCRSPECFESCTHTNKSGEHLKPLLDDSLPSSDDPLSSSDEDSSLEYSDSHWTESNDDFLVESDSNLHSGAVDDVDDTLTKGFKRRVVANINAFVKRVKQMAPKVNEVAYLDEDYFEGSLSDIPLDEGRNALFLNLVQIIVGVASKLAVIARKSTILVRYLD
ncbi:hypothetical protein IWW57_003780 [Coemansia sp. S610]|nr:hypothetical protein IWW57_003780 [Coemansia sp. S610]